MRNSFQSARPWLPHGHVFLLWTAWGSVGAAELWLLSRQHTAAFVWQSVGVLVGLLSPLLSSLWMASITRCHSHLERRFSLGRYDVVLLYGLFAAFYLGPFSGPFIGLGMVSWHSSVVVWTGLVSGLLFGPLLWFFAASLLGAAAIWVRLRRQAPIISGAVEF